MIIKEKVNLADFTTFKIGGIAENFHIPETTEELISLKEKSDLNTYILGNGSNILINDNRSFKNVILLNEFNKKLIHLGGGLFEVGASVKLLQLAKFINSLGYGGIENLYTVPGLIGGALVSNAGNSKSKGIFIGNYLKSVKVLKENKIIELSNEECEFGFRKSIFKGNNNMIILEAIFQFDVLGKEEIENRKQDKLNNVKKHQDLSKPSLGSVFSQANGKILRIVRFIYFPFHRRGVQFSKSNPSWLSNNGKGTYKQVIRIIKLVKLFHKLFRQTLRIEIEIWH